MFSEFVFATEVKEPWNLTEVSMLLNKFFGICGYPQSVSYIKKGICFNRNRYKACPDEGIIFDSQNKFGTYEGELSKEKDISYLMKVSKTLKRQ